MKDKKKVGRQRLEKAILDILPSRTNAMKLEEAVDALEHLEASRGVRFVVELSRGPLRAVVPEINKLSRGISLNPDALPASGFMVELNVWHVPQRFSISKGIRVPSQQLKMQACKRREYYTEFFLELEYLRM